MITISVILTTYNSEEHINRAISSVLNQEGVNSKFNIELIVIDDCSSDNTVEYLNQNNIAFVSTLQNSGGPNKGRNIGLKKSSGDYIIIMDHDDEWHKDRVLQQLKYADKAPIITCAHTLIEDGKVKHDLSRDYDSKEYGLNTTFKHKISKTKNKQHAYLGGIMFHKNLKEILFEEHFGQIDFDWVVRLFKDNNSVEVGKSLYNRYVFGRNLSLDKKYRIRDYYYSLMTLEDFESSFPKECSLGRKRINGTRARYHYLIGEMNVARRLFLKSGFSLKTILFLLTSFCGYKFVIKRFHFFG